MLDIKLIPGPINRNRGFAIRAANGTLWWRHTKVQVDGKTLEGSIQTRERTYGPKFGRRVDSITCFKGSCVLGHDVDWLIRMNDPQTAEDRRTVDIVSEAK